jgi:hypothetical protein
MEKNIEILQFLDGSLSHEEEAELLHRLSVSPERRDILRSHIDQRVLFQRDREAINIPYAAEQKLWSRLAELMPAVPAATIPSGTTAVINATRGLRWISVASISTICVVVGLLSGFYLGRNSASDIATTPIQQTILAVEQPNADLTPSTPLNTARAERSSSTRHFSEAPLAQPVITDRSANVDMAAATTEAEPPVAISTVPVRTAEQTSYVLEPAERSHSLAGLIEATQQSEASVYPMELSFAESFGMQFPTDAQSRNTQPLITNSTISGMYQIYHGRIEFWVGGSIGSANLAKKTLREDYQPGGGSKIVADINHQQTTWIGPFAQARHRLNEQLSLMASAGFSYSDLGTLFYGEFGGRYDLTDQVGITMGVRSFHLPYDLTQEQADVTNSATYKSDTGGPNYGGEWSHNLEILTGMFFRF